MSVDHRHLDPKKRHDSAPAKSSFPERFHHQALSCKMSYNQNTPYLEGQKNHEHENNSVKNVLFYWDQGKKVRSLKNTFITCNLATGVIERMYADCARHQLDCGLNSLSEECIPSVCKRVAHSLWKSANLKVCCDRQCKGLKYLL